MRNCRINNIKPFYEDANYPKSNCKPMSINKLQDDIINEVYEKDKNAKRIKHIKNSQIRCQTSKWEISVNAICI